MKKILLCLVILSQISFSQNYICGDLTFPAKRNIDFEKGTFEIFYKQVVQPTDKYELGIGSHRPICVFLRVDNEDKPAKNGKAKDFFIIFGLWSSNERRTLHTSFFNENAEINKNLAADKLDEGWNHAAFTWELTGKGSSKGKDKYKVTSYLNGKMIRTKEDEFETKRMDRDATIKIGHAASYLKKSTDSGSIATIDSFRISKRVRTADEIAASYSKGFTEDKDTLLYDDFKGLKQDKKYSLAAAKKSPKKAIGKTAHKKSSQRGTFAGPYKIVEGRNGSQAIEMFTK